jgi:hypothetical protein
MHILLGIRMKMVVSMFRSPPKDAFLAATLGKDSKDELKHPAR